MAIEVRLHTDLLEDLRVRAWRLSCAHYSTVTALANFRMMHQEDLADLPYTAMQRFLDEAGACVAGRTYVGDREDREVLREAAAEFGLDWGVFTAAASHADVDELSFEAAWELYERWVASGETLNLNDPDGEDE